MPRLVVGAVPRAATETETETEAVGAAPAGGSPRSPALGEARHGELMVHKDPFAPEPREARIADVAPAAATSTVDAADAPAPSDDLVSIPPAVDPAHDDEAFFSEGDLGRHLVGDEEEEEDLWEIDPARAAKHSPLVVARRERLARYVRWTVGGAALVCLAALAQTALATRGSGASSPGTGALGAASVAAPAQAAEPPADPAAALPAAESPAPAAEDEPTEDGPGASADEDEPTAAEPVAAEPAAAEPVAAEPVAAEPVAAEPVAAEPVAADEARKTALDEKNASRGALERGKLDVAIAAGERSVALDAEDGEAWLILGASYQQNGNVVEARRCYASCLRQGKRGPRGECAAMLR